MRIPNYHKSAFIEVTNARHPCVTGWDKIAAELQRAIGRGRVEKPILVVDCYPGVDEAAVLKELESRLAPKLAVLASDAYHLPEKIEQLVAPFLRGDDFRPGRLPNLSLVNFFNAEPLWRLRRTIDELKEGLVLIVGCGASLIAWGHILVFADLARGTAEERLLRNETGNLGADNKTMAAQLKHKRALLVDWGVADRWKRPLIRRWDYVLDTNVAAEPKLADAGDVRAGMREAATRPFRLVPSFDRASQGEGHPFSCLDWVPEENSLLLGLGDTRLEIPAMDLMFYQARALLGEAVHLRFGDKFPIRFDSLEAVTQGSNSSHLLNGIEPIKNGDGRRDEKMALLERNFVETHRQRFSKKVLHCTNGGVNVLNLAEGEESVVESPTDAFTPFVVRHGETFVVPAAVGEYTICPHGPSVGTECATMKAFVRTSAWA